MDRERYRQLLLAGTVTFPATLPRVAELSLQSIEQLPVAEVGGVDPGSKWLRATERPSPRVTLIRSILVTEVRAVFLPQNPANFDWDQGTWLLESEVLPGLQMQLNDAPRVLGVLYVPEFSPTLLEVHTGMTAAESAQYYPPLPCDRSRDHYQAGGTKLASLTAQAQTGASGLFTTRQEHETPCDSYIRSAGMVADEELYDPHLADVASLRSLSHSQCDDGFLDRSSGSLSQCDDGFLDRVDGPSSS
ncbi:hypothetical protein RMSM_03575 [Rhodopirellula maiorica SM1]|uniref:Uncharacterized protein n=1 Tax=Rhodopirellula maiorica SM1 TaxID=1265738 RepID=M5RJK7_9BACT|nr:hypothetical protein [Rhodopirellula maiorica]EMI19485.1 hypothetical protein RMSM_03575 [Rhodopirellula maiorica SM1]